MKYDELMEKALQELKENDDLFIEVIDELDAWNGYADGFRCYEMCELDELHCGMKLSEFLEKITDDFNFRDDYFYYSIYGLESTDDKTALYRENVDEGDLLDEIIDKYNHLDLNWIDKDFDNLIFEIVNYTGEETGEVETA